MRFRKIVLAVLSGVFLCLPSCKIIPAVPEGAEGCPIWSSKPGMIWAGIINGAYPVSGIFNSLKIVPYSSTYPKMSKDRQLIQSAIEELRTIEPHIVRELDTNSDKPREMDKLGGITFDIGEDPDQLQQFYFGFYRENVCILTFRSSEELSITSYQLDTGAEQLVDDLVQKLGSAWDYMNEESLSYRLQKAKPSEAKAKTLRHPPKPRSAPPSGKGSKNSQNFTAKGTQNAVRINHVPPLRVPFAVKFWEFLEPSPKEGSERGLGRRPKVFAYL